LSFFFWSAERGKTRGRVGAPSTPGRLGLDDASGAGVLGLESRGHRASVSNQGA